MTRSRALGVRFQGAGLALLSTRCRLPTRCGWNARRCPKDQGVAMTTSRRLSVLALAIGLASCVHRDSLSSVWENPLRHDGEVFDLTIFPFDSGSLGSLVMCLRPCASLTYRGASIFVPNDPQRFRGARGDTPYRAKVRLDSSCFQPDAVCTEAPFVFEELAVE